MKTGKAREEDFLPPYQSILRVFLQNKLSHETEPQGPAHIITLKFTDSGDVNGRDFPSEMVSILKVKGTRNIDMQTPGKSRIFLGKLIS